MHIVLFNLINGWQEYYFLAYFSIVLSYIFVCLIPLVLVLWIVFKEERKMFSFSLLFLSTFTTWLVSEIIKNVTRIGRPVIENLMIVEKGFSFPSEHSSLSMVIAIVVLSINKKAGYFLIFISLLIGISRIILGVHFPIDVFAGWLVGLIVGMLFVKLFKRV